MGATERIIAYVSKVCSYCVSDVVYGLSCLELYLGFFLLYGLLPVMGREFVDAGLVSLLLASTWSRSLFLWS
jgi:hypothetical protein